MQNLNNKNKYHNLNHKQPYLYRVVNNWWTKMTEKSITSISVISNVCGVCTTMRANYYCWSCSDNLCENCINETKLCFANCLRQYIRICSRKECISKVKELQNTWL